VGAVYDSRVGTAELDGLRAVLEASPDLVFAADPDDAVIYLNAVARARWGDELGRNARDLVGEPLAKAITDAPTRFQWGEHGPGGVRAWFSASIARLAGGGYWCHNADVTELKHEEERLRRSEQLLVDTQGTAHLGTWDWDITQPNAVWSDELYRIYGLTPETYTPSYEAYLTKIHPHDRQRVIDATNRVFHEHVPYSHDERIFRPDGSIRHLHTWAHPVLDHAGKLVRLIGVCQDVTDRALAEEAVRELNVGLEARVAERTNTIKQSMRDLEQFSSMVSHDLRAPLAVIQLSTDLILREKELSPRTRTNVGRVQRSVEHMSQLLEDLLGLARVGHAEVRHVDLDLSRMCKQIVDELRASGPREADVRIADGIRCLADEGLMRVAMTNLLSNAWKFSATRPRTMIEVAVAEHGILRIRDNGAGFDMKDASKLFAAFQRLHRTEEFPGTGVGLATVHRIVERHGGRIWAESAPDAGATFFVGLASLHVHS
jgi:PAS domain S-box-containing protein